MTEKQPMGLLFDSVAYYTPNDINTLCDDMNFEQAYYMMIQALEFAHKSRIFTLQESEIVSKSLRIMNKHFTEDQTEE
jgi:hypothetical protein